MICTSQEAWGRYEISIESYVVKAEGKIRLGIPRLRWQHYIKTDLYRTKVCGLTNLAQNIFSGGSCQVDIEAWNEILGGEIFYELNDFKFLQTN
jgi:hypothetical protein